jgi:hypothetical protein
LITKYKQADKPIMKNLFSLKLANQLLTVITLFASSQGFTQKEEEDAGIYNDWYQVEFIVFKNLNNNARQQEQWPSQKQLTLTKDTQSLNALLNIPLPRALQAAKEADELALLQQEMTKPSSPKASSVRTDEDAIDATTALIDPDTIADKTIGKNTLEKTPDDEKLQAIKAEPAPVAAFIPALAEQLVLKNQAKQLKYNSNYKVIYHGAWQQQLSDGQPMTSFRLAVEIDGNELDGTINIIRKRYLHVAADLWMHEIANNNFEINTALKQQKHRSVDNKSVLTAENVTTNGQVIEAIEYARLFKRERMKSNELHYIDHPLMGMLIQITPSNQLKPISGSVKAVEKTK